MDIINQILNTHPNSLPPVTRDELGFHHIEIEYKGETLAYTDKSLSHVLKKYHEFVLEVNHSFAGEHSSIINKHYA